LGIGLIVVNILEPGKGVKPILSAIKSSSIIAGEQTDVNWVEFIAHIVPHNIIEAFAKGDILQILFFAILFGFGLSKMGYDGSGVINTFDKLSHVLFNMMKFIMKLAPLGAFGGMAYTVGLYGLETLVPMLKILVGVYITCILFIFVVFILFCGF